MKRPRWYWVLALLLLVVRPSPILSLTRPRPHPTPTRSPARPPNILILISDDQPGGSLGIDGDPRRATPALDQLAAAGVRFDRAYCNSPVCTASRQSLITGRMPHAVRVTRLQTPLPDDAVTLGDWASDLGYRTAAFGKMHFNDDGRHGFEERADTEDWFRERRARPGPREGRRKPWRPFVDPVAVWLNASCESTGIPAADEEATYIAGRAERFIQEHRDEPFLMVVGFHEPHAPFVFPREWAGRYRPADFATPEVTAADRRDQPLIFRGLRDDQIRGVQAAYYSSLSWMDANVGRILDTLRREGLDESTIVVFVSDNGYLLGQHGRFEKNCFYEDSVRVPMLVRWSGHLPAGGRVADLVELVDVVPTVLDLAGQPSPPDLHGQSLAPLLNGGPGVREVVVSEYPENEEAMARSSRYKLIVGSGVRRRRDGLESYEPQRGPYLHLYDVVADPEEREDLAGRPALARVVRSLRHALYRRLVATREGLEPVPPWLSETEAIHWCLIPTDEKRLHRLAMEAAKFH